LSRKEETEERITNDVLKSTFNAIKEEFVEVINNSLRELENINDNTDSKNRKC